VLAKNKNFEKLLFFWGGVGLAEGKEHCKWLKTRD